jgi:hypothetical protein
VRQRIIEQAIRRHADRQKIALPPVRSRAIKRISKKAAATLSLGIVLASCGIAFREPF